MCNSKWRGSDRDRNYQLLKALARFVDRDNRDSVAIRLEMNGSGDD